MRPATTGSKKGATAAYIGVQACRRARVTGIAGIAGIAGIRGIQALQLVLGILVSSVSSCPSTYTIGSVSGTGTRRHRGLAGYCTEPKQACSGDILNVTQTGKVSLGSAVFITKRDNWAARTPVSIQGQSIMIRYIHTWVHTQ